MQQHLLRFLDELSTEEKEILLNKVNSIDYDLIEEIYKNMNFSNTNTKVDSVFEPPEVVDKDKLSTEELNELKSIGEQIIKNGQYAVVTMAGGQGTRLEFDGPKALYPLEFLNGKTLIELQAELILEASKNAGGTICWYIMINTEYQKIMEDFIEQKNYFGLSKNNIKLFPQGNIPIIDENGKILMKNKYTIIEGPDGNGGIYEAMKKQGILEDIRNRKIKYVFTCNIDNPLIKLADTVYIGLAEKNKIPIAGKSTIKKHSKEKVGVFGIRDNHPAIIEYSDMSEEMLEKKNENGELMYGDGNIVAFLINTEVLELVASKELPYHKAIKKYSYINDDGDIITPSEPNAYKFEKFMFDIFVYIDKLLVFRIKREEEFAPIKNKEGEDSPKTAEELYKNYINRGGIN